MSENENVEFDEMSAQSEGLDGMAEVAPEASPEDAPETLTEQISETPHEAVVDAADAVDDAVRDEPVAEQAEGDAVPDEAHADGDEAKDEAGPEPEAEPENKVEPQPAPAPESAPAPKPDVASTEASQKKPLPNLRALVSGIPLPALITAGVLALAFVALLCWLVVSRPAQTLTPESRGEQTEEQDGGEKTEGSEQQTRTYGSGVLENVDPTWLDVNGVPTIRALCEAEGWQLETLLQQKGWKFDASLEWLVDPLDAGLSITGMSGRYDDMAIAELAPGGGQNPAVYLITVPAKVYETAQAAFEEIAQVNVEQQQWVGDMGLAVVVSPSQVKYFVLCVPDAAGSYHSIMVFNVASLEAGLFDQLAGGSFGKTPNEVFQNMLTGVGTTTEQQ